MNILVRDYGTYIDENFCAVIHLQSSRANGICGVRTYIHVLTEVYMDTDAVSQVLQYLSGLNDASTVSSILAVLVKLTKYKDVAAALAAIGTTTAGVVMVYSWQIRIASASNRGIVMSILDDGTTATPTVGFSSQ